MELWRKLVFLFRRRQFDRELDEEMRVHLEMKSEQQGRAAARRQFGNVTRLQEVSREVWGFTWLETLLQDLRYGLRMLSKNPGFTTVAVLSLALGIGVNTTIFSLVNAFGLRPLPVQKPEELVFIGAQSEPGNTAGFCYPLFEAVRDHNRTLAGIFVYTPGAMNVAVDGEAELARNGGQYVSDDYFAVLGVRAMVGRCFTPADDQPVAVIGYDYWERRFGRDPAVVGKSIDVNAHPFTIIGVTPRQFFAISVGKSFDVTVPLRMYPQLNPGSAEFNSAGNWWLQGMARLKPGVSAAQATADLNVVFQQHVTRRCEGLQAAPA